MVETATDYTLPELMCVEGARLMPDTGVAVLGLGLPVLSGVLAKCMHHPDIVVCTEVGVFDWAPDVSRLARSSMGIHDLILNHGAAGVSDMVDVLGTALMGQNVDFGYLTGAQVDRFGNVNTLVMGDYRAPARRLAGTGGNTEIACLAPRIFVLMPQEPRRWVERVDFITSPGYIDGPGARLRAGLDPQGPNTIVSTMGVFGYDTTDGSEGSCELVLEAVFPGFDVDIIASMIPWPLRLADTIREVAPPTIDELDLLRRLDPHMYYLTPGRY